MIRSAQVLKVVYRSIVREKIGKFIALHTLRGYLFELSEKEALL